MRKVVVVLFLAAAVWFMIPLLWGILHIGMIYPAVMFLVAAWMISNSEKVKKAFSGRFRRVVRVVLVLAIIGVLAVVVPMGFMVGAACKTPEDNATVIVLGCQVRGSEPSRMLTDRCNAALKYLNEHPDAKCVASGGKGSGEDISEAQAIRNYLVSHGVSEDRIYLEDRSTNTSENLSFSAELIREKGLNTEVAIASDNFHQLRASIFAKRNGLTPSAIGCPTYWLLTAGYWTREVLAVYKALVLGY